MADIYVGTAGFGFYDPSEGWQDTYQSKLAAYTDAFPAGELNRTFYDPPQIQTAERWRREAADQFEFTLKAWQAITHPWDSPTWNGYRETASDMETDALGYCRPTETVRNAWEQTLQTANALDARVIVLQTPPSFDCTDEHARQMRTLLSSVDRDGVTLAWEPRGDWIDHPDRIAELCRDLDLVHVVDIMRRGPAIEQDVCYTRLHGRNEDPYDYDYDYTQAELETLAARLREAADHHARVYCIFNNFEMYENASALLDLLAR